MAKQNRAWFDHTCELEGWTKTSTGGWRHPSLHGFALSIEPTDARQSPMWKFTIEKRPWRMEGVRRTPLRAKMAVEILQGIISSFDKEDYTEE